MLSNMHLMQSACTMQQRQLTSCHAQPRSRVYTHTGLASPHCHGSERSYHQGWQYAVGRSSSAQVHSSVTAWQHTPEIRSSRGPRQRSQSIQTCSSSTNCQGAVPTTPDVNQRVQGTTPSDRGAHAQPVLLAAGACIRQAALDDVTALAALDAACHADGSAGWSAALYQDEVARQRPLGPSLLLLLEVQAPPANTPTQAGTSVLAGSGAQCGAAVPAQLDSATQAGNMMAHAGSIHQACSTSPLGSMSQQGVQRQIQGLVAGSIVIDELQVTNVALHPYLRGRGLGTAMVQALLQEARSLGCSGAVLEVSARNEQAAALYTRMGFQSVGRRKRYYDDGSDAVIMSSTLA